MNGSFFHTTLIPAGAYRLVKPLSHIGTIKADIKFRAEWSRLRDRDNRTAKTKRITDCDICLHNAGC